MIQSTPAAARRELRRADRRDAMLDAAMTIVLDGGLDGLTIAKLAAAMGMAVGAMYRYFPSKSSLIFALQDREALALGAHLKAAGDAAVALGPKLPPGETALVRVFGIARHYLRHAASHPRRHHLVDATLSAPKQLLDEDDGKQGAGVMDTVLEQVSVPLATAAHYGAIRDGDALARTYILWAAVHGFDHVRKRDRTQPRHLRAPALIELAMVDLLRGWGAAEAVITAVLATLRLS